MYSLSKKSKKNIERIVGLSIEQIDSLSPEEAREWVKKKTDKEIKFSKSRKNQIVGRGNPLLSRRKIRTLDDVNKKSKMYIGA